MIVPFLFEILLIGLLGYAIVRFARGRAGGDRSGEPLRRFFEYALLLAVVVIVGIGLGGLLERALAEGSLVRRDEAALARSLAFVMVGLPALGWLAHRLYRRLRADPQERASFAWAAYLTVAQSAALLTAMVALARTLRWVLGEADYDAAALATAIVWSLVWAGHWVAAGRLGWPERLQLRDLFGSAAGLIGAAVAAGYGLGSLLSSAYDEAFRQVVAEAPGDAVRVAAAWLAVAVPVWWWHWLRRARRQEITGLWRGYVLLLGVLGGVLTALASLGATLFLVAQWLVGDPGTIAAADHFAPVAGAAGALAAGAAVWAYHRNVLAALRRERSEVDRVYNYLLSAVGLGAAAGGLATLLASAIDAALPSSRLVVDTPAGDVLAVAVALLAIGLPVWLRQWSAARRHAAADPHGERSSPVRRSYLLTVTGVGAVATLVSAIVLLVVLFEDALEGRLTAETLRNVEVPLSIFVTAGAVAVGHARELRVDRVLAPPPARPAVSDVLLIAGDGAELGAALADQVGVPVRAWRRLDGNGAAQPVPLDEVVAAVRASPHEHLLVLTDETGAYNLVPVEPTPT